MKLHVGTSGFSYAEWRGTFYPEDLPAKGMLAFYAARFGAVEINNTFYRMPDEATLGTWAGQTPEAFTFVLKAPRRITHMKRLREVGDDVAYFAKTSAALAARRGPLLFQLPPNLKKDVARLGGLLAAVPADARAALEFREASWSDPEVDALLRECGAALCIADTDEEPCAGALPVTADWGYLRLRRAEYGDDALRDWARRIADTGWRQAFVFFKHEDEGRGPAFAARFAEFAAAP